MSPRICGAAFILQTAFLLALALALRPLALPAEFKAPVVAVFGAIPSFATAGLLIRRRRDSRESCDRRRIL